MKRLLTVSLLIVSLTTYAKTESSEFEGVIHYHKSVTRLSDNKKAVKYEKYVHENLGAKSDFYYKSGNHLWHRLASRGKELLQNKSKFLYVKESDEYVNWRKSGVSKETEEVTSIKIVSELDTILGYPCQVLEVKSRLLPLSYGTKMYRKFYFNRESFYINYKYLKHYKMNSQDEIFKMLECLPLRIYVEIHGVVLDYEATGVDFKVLDESMFQTPPSNS